MIEIEKTIKTNLINYCYDEIDNGEYRMYLNNISTPKGWSYLFIRVENEHNSYPQAFISDPTDTQTEFVDICNVSDKILLQILNQMLIKKDEKKKEIDKKNQLIKEIILKYHISYDVPKNVAVPSIMCLLTDRCLNSDKTWVGEVGLNCNEKGYYLSVFFPDKIDPAFSHDISLKSLSLSELQVILDSMKKPKTTNECASEFFNNLHFRIYKP